MLSRMVELFFRVQTSVMSYKPVTSSALTCCSNVNAAAHCALPRFPSSCSKRNRKGVERRVTPCHSPLSQPAPYPEEGLSTITQINHAWLRAFTLLFALLISPLTAAPLHAAEFSAQIDRSAATLGEPVTLTLTLLNSDVRLRAEGVNPNVDLSVLHRDFNVGRPRAEHRYNIYRGQGRSTSSIIVELFPKRSGKLTIPAFEIEGLRSAALSVEAHDLAADAAPEVFARSGVSKRLAWQREQILVWLDVYHRVQLKNASVGEYIAAEPVPIELLEYRELPQNERTEHVNGVTYNVTRIAWAVFPRDVGTLTLQLPDVWVVMADENKVHLPHASEQIDVRALPAEVSASIPVGVPQLTQTSPAPAPTVNQLSSWAVTVSGPLGRFTLPDSLPLAAPPARVKLYSDRAQRDSAVTSQGLITQVTYTLSALAQLPGSYSLEPIRVPYFDPEAGQLRVAELPGPTLTVSAAPAAIASLTPFTTTEPQTAPAASGQASTAPASKDLWPLITAIISALWLATLALWWRQDRRVRPSVATPSPTRATLAAKRASHPLKDPLLAAFGTPTLEQGLATWEARHGIDERVRDTVRAVQQHCYGEDKNTADDELRTAVNQAALIIRQTKSKANETPSDPWQPESFTPTSSS